MEETCNLGCTAVESDLCKILTSEELNVIHDQRDVGIIARIKAMSTREFDYFQAHCPKQGFVGHYVQIQRPWIAESIYLLEKRLGRKPTGVEEATDYRDKNAARFRVYYALKHPNNVEISGNCGQRAS